MDFKFKIIKTILLVLGIAIFNEKCSNSGSGTIPFIPANQGTSVCTDPKTSVTVADGIFSEQQEVAFYSSCKYYKTYYEIDGISQDSQSIGSGSIKIPSSGVSENSITVVKLKYWSECYQDAELISKCPETEDAKISTYVFNTKVPIIEVLSQSKFYINNSNNTIANYVFRASSAVDDSKQLSYEIILKESEISKVIASGSINPNTDFTQLIYANSLNLGSNILQLKVKDYLNNTASVTLEVIVDDQPPILEPNFLSGLYGMELDVKLNNKESVPFVGGICYTVDGSEPKFNFSSNIDLDESNLCSQGNLYNGTDTISIEKTSILKFVAVDLSGNITGIQSYSYQIRQNSPTIQVLPIDNPYLQKTDSRDIKFISDSYGTYKIHISDGSGKTEIDSQTGEEKFVYDNLVEIDSGSIEEGEEKSVNILGNELFQGQNLVFITVIQNRFMDDGQKEFTGITQTTLTRDDDPPVSNISPKSSVHKDPFIAHITSEEGATIYYQASELIATTSSENGNFRVYNPNKGIRIWRTDVVRFYAIDRAGNMEVEQSIEYTIDQTPPEISITDIIPQTKRVSTSIQGLENSLEIGISSNENGRFEVRQGGCPNDSSIGGTILAQGILEGHKVVPSIDASFLSDGYSKLDICVYDSVGNLANTEITNIFRDEKGDFLQILDASTDKPFQNFRAWEMPGDAADTLNGNKVLIITQGITWKFDEKKEIEVSICELNVCAKQVVELPEELSGEFIVPTDINEIAKENKSQYKMLIYLAYPLGMRIEDRANYIYDVYLRKRLLNELDVTSIDWVGISEGTLINLELIDKFSSQTNKRIFAAPPFQGSLYSDALAKGVLGENTWNQYKDIITQNAPEINDLLTSSTYTKERVPILLNRLLSSEGMSKSFLIPMNYKNLGLDLVVSVESQMAGTPTPFKNENIAVVSGSHFEMGVSPAKDSIRSIVTSILQNGVIPQGINQDLVNNKVPISFIDGKWIAPIYGNGMELGSIGIQPTGGTMVLDIQYDNPEWKVDSTITINSNTFKDGFLETSADLYILKKDVGATIQGPFKLEVVFDMERFKKSTNYAKRHASFKEYPIHLYYVPKTVTTCRNIACMGRVCNTKVVPWIIMTFPGLNAAVYVSGFRLGFKDKPNFRILTNLNGSFHHKKKMGCFFACWYIEHKIKGWANFDFQYKNGEPILAGNLKMDFWGLGIDNWDFTAYIKQIHNTVTQKSYYIDVPDKLAVDTLFIRWFVIDLRPVEKMHLTLPYLDKSGNPIR